MDLWTFLRLLFLPSLVVIGINIAVFFLLYRRQVQGSFDAKRLPTAAESIRHRGYFRYTCAVLLLVALAYIITSALQAPLSLVALGGAFVLLIGALLWKQITFKTLGGQISWPIFGFIGGMFIVVRAVENTHLTTQFGQLLIHLSGGTSLGAVVVGTAGAALGTNLINNIPMAIVMRSALGAVGHIAPSARLGFIAATMFGCDLGPNLTTVGSLATILRLLILRRRNLDVSGLDYFKVGILITPFMLLAGVLTIWLLLL